MLGDAAHGPRLRPLDRLLLVAAGVEQRGQLVEREHDVGAQLMLDLHRHLGREPVRRAVEMRLERDAVVVDVREALLAFGDDVVGLHAHGLHREHLLEPDAERHHLEAAAVGEGGAVPVHELAETAGLVDDVGSRLQVQVVRVGEHGLRAEVLHRLRQHRLDGRLGADRDERGRPDVPVRGMDGAGAAQPVGQAGAHREERVGRGRHNITHLAMVSQARRDTAPPGQARSCAVSSRYSQSIANEPSPTSNSRARSARSRSSAATLSGSPDIALYTAIVGP